MRILMTQRELCHRGGSEIFTIEVAVELRKRGHDLAVFSPRVGNLAEFMLAGGVLVKSRLSEIPWVPEVIHGQHHLQAMAAMAYFDTSPAIYHCHGVSPWVEKPPAHPGIYFYLMMCSWMIPRLEAELGVPRERITSLPNFVNTARFSRRRTPPKTIRRALLFGNARFPDADIIQLEAVCEEAGITLDKIGTPFDNPQPRPELFLLEYDLVFAIGKCAAEALACQCAVIPLLPKQAGHLVTPENFSEWLASNFSPRYYSSAAQVDLDWLRQELGRYSPENTVAICDRLRKEHNLHGAVDQLEVLYQRSIDEHNASRRTSTARDFAPYLEATGQAADLLWAASQDGVRLRAESEAWQRLRDESEAYQRLRRESEACHRLQAEFEALQLRFRATEKKVIDLRQKVAEQKLAWKLMVAQLRPSFSGRRWLSKIQRTVTRVLPDKQSG